MACDTAGVGVYASCSASMMSMPLAASTSTAVVQAGTDRACVSKPRKSGPLILRTAGTRGHSTEHSRLGAAGDEEQDLGRGVDDCRRQGDTPHGRRARTCCHHPACLLVNGGASRKERCGMPILTQSQEDEV